MSDSLSSTTVVVNSLGVVAAQRFAPYGQARWAGGTMPTSYAFTGQRADTTTGLDYYGARYYDPAAGIFISADTVLPGKGFSPAGLNRYAYVSGNPETMTDLTGHMPGSGGGQGICKYDPDGSECQGGGGGSGGSGGSGGTCRTDASCDTGGGSGSNGGGGSGGSGGGGGGGKNPPPPDCQGTHIGTGLCESGDGHPFPFYDDSIQFTTLIARGHSGLIALIAYLGDLINEIEHTTISPIFSAADISDLITTGSSLAGFFTGFFLGGGVAGSLFSTFLGWLAGVAVNRTNTAQDLYNEEVSELQRGKQNLLNDLTNLQNKVIDSLAFDEEYNSSGDYEFVASIYEVDAEHDTRDYPLIGVIMPWVPVGLQIDTDAGPCGSYGIVCH